MTKRLTNLPSRTEAVPVRFLGSTVVLILVALLGIGAVAQFASAQSSNVEPTATDAPWIDLKKGLKVRDLVVGDGDEARRGKRVSMRYAGWLDDGTLFDSNRKRALFVFQLGAGQVIKGWELGVVGMRVGGTRQLLIPAQLAYGKRGRPPSIPKNATLLFEIDLRGVF